MNYLLLRDRLYVWWTRNFGRIKCLFLGHDTATRYSASGRARASIVFCFGSVESPKLMRRCHRCWSAVTHPADSGKVRPTAPMTKREETKSFVPYNWNQHYNEGSDDPNAQCRPTPYIGWRPGDPE